MSTVLLLAVLLAQPVQPADAATTATAAAASATVATAASALPEVVVYKSPTCGCCNNWIKHMRLHGFTVQTHDVDDMDAVKTRLGVPQDKRSCHTATVGGLVVEGHVPADDVIKLLAHPNGARGLAAAGMPMGSPGMEVPGHAPAHYFVDRINADGSTTLFAEHGF